MQKAAAILGLALAFAMVAPSAAAVDGEGPSVQVGSTQAAEACKLQYPPECDLGIVYCDLQFPPSADDCKVQI